MSSEVLPEGWRFTRLGDIAALSGGTTPSRSVNAFWADGAVPWATPTDITSLPPGEVRITATEAQVTDLALKKCSLKLNPPGTVLMTSRATIGYAAINDVAMATNQGFVTFSCRADCDAEFLCQWLNANRNALTAAAGGSTFKELSRGTAKLLPILLPPPDEQRRIAEVLRSVDETAKGNSAVLTAATETLGLLSDERLVANAQRVGEAVRLGDLIETIEAGVSVNSEGRLAGPNEIGILKTSCVSAGHFEPKEHKAVLESERTRVRVPVRGDSIIMSRMNTFELVGANAFVDADHAGLYLPDRLWLLKASSRVRIRWLAFYLKTARFRDQIVSIATGTSGSMKNISKSRLNDLIVHVPDHHQQAEDIEALTAVEAVVFAARRIEDKLKLAAMAVKSDLLSGRVRVPA